LLALLLALGLVASACGKSSKKEAKTTSSTTATTAASTATTAAGGSSEGTIPKGEPDVNGDGKVSLGILSPGDTNDKGYYESFVDAAKKLADENGWKTIIVDKINPADALNQARNMCRQNVDLVAIAASELKDAIPAAAEPACSKSAWYVAGGQGVVQTPYFAQSQDDVNESLYAAGVAAGELMKDSGATKAGYITGPELDFSKAAAKAWEVGIKSVVANATVVKTYTGDFDDSAKGKEAAQAQLSQGVKIIYPYLGGATFAVAQLAQQSNVPVLTPGTDNCAIPSPKFAISVIFSPGDYFAAALKDFKAGTLKMGVARMWRMGKDPVPTVKICSPKAGQQEAVDKVISDIGSGALKPADVVKAAP
jgi:basic membrane protein A